MSAFLETIPKIVITQRDSERHKKFIKRMKQVGVYDEVEVSDAVMLPQKQNGCTAAWHNAASLAKGRGYEVVLIMEDDVLWRQDAESVLENLRSLLYRNGSNFEYDMIYFGVTIERRFLPKHDYPLFRLSYGLSTHAIMMRHNMLDELLKIPSHHDKLAFDMFTRNYYTVDVFFSTNVIPRNKVYSLNPMIAAQPPLVSPGEQWIKQMGENCWHPEVQPRELWSESFNMELDDDDNAKSEEVS